MESEPLKDLLGRPLKNLRLSVTDRCNLRCSYCMPEAEYVWLPRGDILHFEEMSTLIDVFARAGVDRIRLTGGEPLLRRDLPELIRMIARKPAIRDLALTTNGALLVDQARALHQAGLHRLTVSLDTLRPDRFHALTRFDALPQVLAGIGEATKYFTGIKLDSVIIRGTNEDELVPLVEYARLIRAEVRFIEYMDVGGATQWSRDRVMSRQEMLTSLAREYGPIAAVIENTSAPADRFRLRRWHRVRHHLVDNRSILPQLRQKPPDCRRHVVSLSVCDERYGSPHPTPSGNVAGRSVSAHQDGMVGAIGSRGRGATRDARSIAPRASQQPKEEPSPRNAHARRLA